MPENPDGKSQARFVFRGTVQRLRAATMARLTDTQNMIVVRVDQIIKGPEVCKDFVGRQITVQTDGGVQFQRSTTGIFYTNVSLFGESLAVNLLDFEAGETSGPTLQAALAAHADPARALEHDDITRRVNSADLVVSGRITAVRVLGEPSMAAPSAAAAAGAPPPQPEPISEHAPVWQEATVQVDTVLKGKHEEKTVRVRFPASTDVRWHRAPKLRPGQEGVFILHGGEVTEAAKGMVAGAGLQATGTDGPVFTALHPHDFQAADQSDDIRHIASLTGDGRTP